MICEQNKPSRCEHLNEYCSEYYIGVIVYRSTKCYGHRFALCLPTQPKTYRPSGNHIVWLITLSTINNKKLTINRNLEIVSTLSNVMTEFISGRPTQELPTYTPHPSTSQATLNRLLSLLTSIPTFQKINKQPPLLNAELLGKEKSNLAMNKSPS